MSGLQKNKSLQHLFMQCCFSNRNRALERIALGSTFFTSTIGQQPLNNGGVSTDGARRRQAGTMAPPMLIVFSEKTLVKYVD
jgi:hypothetical protein